MRVYKNLNVFTISFLAFLIGSQVYAVVSARVELRRGGSIQIDDIYSASYKNAACERISFIIDDGWVELEDIKSIRLSGSDRSLRCDVDLNDGRRGSSVSFEGVSYNYDWGSATELDGIYHNRGMLKFDDISALYFSSKSNVSEGNVSRRELSYIVIHATDQHADEIGLFPGIPVYLYEDWSGEKGRLAFKGVTDREGKITFGPLDIPNGSYFIHVNPRDDRYYNSNAGASAPREPIYISHPAVIHESIER